MALVGGLGLATTVSLNLLERRRELGVLRTLGASPAIILSIVIGESLLLALVGFALATVLAGPVASVLGDWLAGAVFGTRLEAGFTLAGVAAWLAVSVAVGVLASALPAWRVARRTVREEIAYE